MREERFLTAKQDKKNICMDRMGDNLTCALKIDRLGHSQQEEKWGYFLRRTKTVKERSGEL